MKESRLRVVFDIPSPPQTIPEHSDEVIQPPMTVMSYCVLQGEEVTVVRETETQRLKREKEELRRQVIRSCDVGQSDEMYL